MGTKRRRGGNREQNNRAQKIAIYDAIVKSQKRLTDLKNRLAELTQPNTQQALFNVSKIIQRFSPITSQEPSKITSQSDINAIKTEIEVLMQIIAGLKDVQTKLNNSILNGFTPDDFRVKPSKNGNKNESPFILQSPPPISPEEQRRRNEEDERERHKRENELTKYFSKQYPKATKENIAEIVQARLLNSGSNNSENNFAHYLRGTE